MFAAALLALSFAPAHALDCASVAMGSTLPADGAVEVPVNARPMVAIYGAGTGLQFELEADGAPVEGAVFAVVAEGDPMVFQLEAPALLAADAAHVLRVVDPESIEGGGEPWTLGEISFQTGSAEDTAPPEALSSVVASFSETEDEWGGERLYSVALEGGEDPSGTAWILELDHDPGFSAPERRIRFGNPAEVRSGWCTFDSAAELDPLETHVRVTPVDAAGNLGEPVSVAVVEQTPFKCGTRCSAVPAPVAGFGALLLGLLGLGRRRER